MALSDYDYDSYEESDFDSLSDSEETSYSETSYEKDYHSSDVSSTKSRQLRVLWTDGSSGTAVRSRTRNLASRPSIHRLNRRVSFGPRNENAYNSRKESLMRRNYNEVEYERPDRPKGVSITQRIHAEQTYNRPESPEFRTSSVIRESARRDSYNRPSGPVHYTHRSAARPSKESYNRPSGPREYTDIRVSSRIEDGHTYERPSGSKELEYSRRSDRRPSDRSYERPSGSKEFKYIHTSTRERDHRSYERPSGAQEYKYTRTPRDTGYRESKYERPAPPARPDSLPYKGVDRYDEIVNGAKHVGGARMERQQLPKPPKRRRRDRFGF